MKKNPEALFQKIGYAFTNLNLLKNAMTHRSIRGQNNERLEFLGDSLLNFVIASELFTRYQSAKEGELSRRRANLVNGGTLAEIAKTLSLGNYLYLGSGELRSGGSHRKSILADALEALIGAIYLDSNFETCQKCILNWYNNRLDLSLKTNLKDAKTQLQEHLQAHRLPLPEYHILKVEGEAHDCIFYVECCVTGLSESTQGFGKTRRRAEQLAAEKLLTLLMP